MRYPHQYLGKYYKPHKYSTLHVHLPRVLKKGNYDVIFIPCHNDLTALLAASYAVVRDIPLVYCADSVKIHPLFKIDFPLRDSLVNLILKKSGAVWVPGEASREYMLDYGVPSARIFQGSYTLDVDDILSSMNDIDEKRIDIRRISGIKDGATVFLMVANMIENRRHELLLKAFARLSRKHSVFLVLIGDGPERPKVEALCARMNMRNVKIYREVGFDDLRYYYGMSDAYVHSGYEPYSTALDYGAVAALPLLTTTAVGAARNYPGLFNSFPLTDPDDVDGLLENMRKAVVFPALAKEAGRKFRQKIKERNARWAADQLRNAIDMALGGSRRT